VVVACVLYSGARGGRSQLAGPSGPKGQMGRLVAGPKVEGNFFSE
jgi:hypothetical protein